jgi:hypothetical protein
MAIETRDDPLLFWQCISATHIVATTGIPHLDAQAAYEKYAHVQQGSDETLLRFQERFGEASTAMQVFQLDISPSNSPVMQARHFMARLDRARYAGFQARIANLKSLLERN